jgi:hypothetical protein
VNFQRNQDLRRRLYEPTAMCVAERFPPGVAEFPAFNIKSCSLSSERTLARITKGAIGPQGRLVWDKAKSVEKRQFD